MKKLLLLLFGFSFTEKLAGKKTEKVAFGFSKEREKWIFVATYLTASLSLSLSLE